MLLNLAIEDKELSIKPKKLNVTKVTSNLKRGSWKKRRMDAKKIVQRLKKGVNNESKIQAKVTIPSEPIQQDEFKRKTQKGHVRADAAKAGFTSSIFTSNPIVDVSKTKIENAIAPDSLHTANVFSDCTFAGLGIHPVLTAHLEKLKVTAPTSIQRQSIPKLVSCLDKDMIIQAQTGSGKTFSFLLPILNQLITASAQLTDKYGNDFFSRATGTLACILVPTRELAQQISAVLDSLLRYTRNVPESKFCKHWIVSGILVGGESKKSEKARIRKGINILVATPGRLLDHLKTTESFDVGNLRWLVLDEADNLLHLGFEETLIEILRIVNEKGNSATQEEKRPCIDGWPFQRQTILCSATIEGGVEKLAQESLREPVFIKVHDENPKTSTKTIDETTKNVDIAIPSQLEQFYLISPAKLRLVSLVGLIRKITQDGQKNCKIMIFLSTGDSVDWHFDSFVRISESPERENEDKIELDSNAEKRPLLYGDLQKLRVGYESEVLPNCRVFKLHGSLLQSERHAVFTGFSPETISSTSLLFCTDVAARGLDVSDVSHIIQYDPPADVKDYIHRIGRTARLGRNGYACTFLLPSEVEYLDLLTTDYNCHLKEEELPQVLTALLPLSSSQSNKKSKHKNYEVAATDVHMKFERFVQSTQMNLLHAQKAFSSHIRAYTTHISSEKHIFHIRKLHLGHIAKSFCLREAPAVLQSRIGALTKSTHEKISSGGGVTAGTMKRKAIQMAKSALTSEFSEGEIYNLSKKRK